MLHSDISGSKPACGSPKLFAAYHVLLRLLVPRHPSCALSSLTTKKNNFLLSTLVCCNYYTYIEQFGKNCSRFFFKTYLLKLSINFKDFTLLYKMCFKHYLIFSTPTPVLVGVLGFEPRTSSLSGTRSNQLSYTPSRFISSRHREVVWWS